MGIINLNLKCANTEVESIQNDNIYVDNLSNDEYNQESSTKTSKYTTMWISGGIVLIPTFGYGGYSIYKQFIDKTEVKPNLQDQQEVKPINRVDDNSKGFSNLQTTPSEVVVNPTNQETKPYNPFDDDNVEIENNVKQDTSTVDNPNPIGSNNLEYSYGSFFDE